MYTDVDSLVRQGRSDALGQAIIVPAADEKLLGFSGTVSQALADTNLSAGANSLIGTTVPAGEVWIITALLLRYDGPSATNLYAYGSVGGVTVLFGNVANPTTTKWYDFTINLALAAGDKFVGYVTPATAGDNLYFRYAGYKTVAP